VQAVDGANATVPDAPSELDRRSDPSVESLVREFDIDEEQAMAQMEVQIAAGRAEQDLPESLAVGYAGRRIEHERSGRVTLAVSSPALEAGIVEHFMSYGLSEVDVVSASLNHDQLDALVEARQSELADVTLDEADRRIAFSRSTLGRITVEVASSELTEGEARLLDSARAAPEVYEIVDVGELDRPVKEVDCDRYGNIECDPPLRGSIRVRHLKNDGQIGVCTHGFNVYSRSDAKPYVLVAGHCYTNSAAWYTLFSNGNRGDIGHFHNWREDAETDTGIISIASPTDWQTGRNWITVNPNYGGHTANDRYLITGILSPGQGDRVCLTAGNYPATTCATVTSTNSSASGTNGLFKTDSALCSMGGDSGGPYFSYGVGYGIHIAGSPAGRSCGKVGYAEHLTEATSRMNVFVYTS
jgi:hypothetical protein